MSDVETNVEVTDEVETKKGIPIFRKELENLINRHCMENGSNTPDFILARYMAECLDAFDKAVKTRTEWYKA